MSLTLPQNQVMDLITLPPRAGQHEQKALEFAVTDLCKLKTVFLDELATRFELSERTLTNFLHSCTIRGSDKQAILVIEDDAALVPTVVHLSPELRSSVGG